MITIVGAGPAGSRAAELLAKEGNKVRILEEHQTIGKPVQCTGLVTHSIGTILKLPDSVIKNRVRDVRIIVDEAELPIRFDRPDLVIDRQRFDAWLAKRAEKAGAEILLGHKFVDAKDNKLKVISKDKMMTLKTDVLIGADGPLSSVAKSQGMFKDRKFWIGSQVRALCKTKNEIRFFPARGIFAWIVPEGKGIARIGIVVRQKPSAILKAFLSDLHIAEEDIIDRQAGLIPIYNTSVNIQKGNVFLLGDAAAQVKATTAGGIIPSLVAAGCLAEAINRKEDYGTLVQTALAKDLFVHRSLRKTLDTFTLEDYKRLIDLCSGPRPRGILQSVDRDSPNELVLRLALAEPKLAFFAKQFLRGMFTGE